MKKLLISLLCLSLLTGCGVRYDYVTNSNVIVEDNQNNTPTEDNHTSNEDPNNLNGYEIYNIYVKATVKVRDYPSTTQGTHLGKIAKGSSLPAYEKQSNEGYTWYRIGTDEWVADDGTWIDESKAIDIKYNDYDDKNSSFFMVRMKANVSILEDSSTSSLSVGNLSSSSLVCAYETINKGNDIWYRIGVNEWVRNRNGEVVVE